MTLNKSLDNKEQNERLLKELTIKLDQMQRDYQNLLEELALKPEQISAYLAEPDHFSPPIWEELQNEKKRLDEKLQTDLSQVKDPLKVKKAFSERSAVQQHWLFVR